MADRNAIAQRIALEGDAEVKRKLEDIGKAGQKAFGQLGDKARQVAAPVGELQSRMLGFVSTVSSAFRSQIPAASATMSGLHSKIMGVSGGLLGLQAGLGATAAGFFALAASSSRSLVELDAHAKALGLTTGEYKQFGAISESLGMEFSELARGLAKLTNTAKDNPLQRLQTEISSTHLQMERLAYTNKNDPWANTAYGQREFAESSARLQDRLSRLNIQMHQVQLSESGLTEAGKALARHGVTFGQDESLSSRLEKLRNLFSRMPDGIKKTQLAMEVFGERQALKMLPFLNRSSAEVKKFNDDLAALGVSKDIDYNRLKVADKFNNEWTLVKKGLEKLKTEFSAGFAEAFLPGIEAFKEKLIFNRKTIAEQFKQMGTTVGQFIKDMTYAFTPTTTPGGLLFLKETQVSQQNQWLITLRQSVLETGAAFASVYRGLIEPAWNGILAVLNRVADALNKSLGTEFTGRGLAIAGIIIYMTGGFGLLAAAIGLVLAPLRILWSIFGYIGAAAAWIGRVTGLTTALGVALRGAFAGVGGWVAAAVAGLGRLGLALALLAGWPGLLLAGAVLVYMYWDQIKAYAIATWNAIAAAFGPAMSALGSAIVSAFNAAWEGIKSGIKAVFDGSVAVASAFWDQVVSLGKAAWESIASAASTVWKGTKNIFGSLFDGAKSMAADAFSWIGDKAQAMYDRLSSILSSVGDLLGKIFAPIKNLFGGGGAAPDITKIGTPADANNRAAEIVAPYEKAAVRIRELTGSTIPDHVKRGNDEVLNRYRQFVTDLNNTLKGLFDKLKEQINELKNAFQVDLVNAVESAMKKIVEAVANAADKIAESVAKIKNAIANVGGGSKGASSSSSASSSNSSGSDTGDYSEPGTSSSQYGRSVSPTYSETPSGGDSTGNFSIDSNRDIEVATGGHVRGPGSGTSDSIPAWLSHGEFVVNARAVKQYGVALLHAINSGNFARRFALGGAVPIPRFSMGGLVGSDLALPAIPELAPAASQFPGKTFDLHIGQRNMGPVYGGPDTIERITRHAAAQTARSAGTRPSWYKG